MSTWYRMYPIPNQKKKRKEKKKTYAFAKIMLSYLYIHLSLIVLFWTNCSPNLSEKGEKLEGPYWPRFIFPNNSCGLSFYNIGQYYPCSLQTMIDFILFLKLQIVRGCGGFPLALEVIGRLHDENPVEAWCRTAKNWSNSHYIFNSNSDLLDCLRKSLEFSDHEVIFKECFMDLGSFPEGQRIPVSALIDMWAELHKLDEVGNNAIHNLHKITTQNMANLVRKRYTDSLFLWSDILVASFFM